MSIQDHWLTIMTCVVCEQTPDHSPLYKCPLGHLICSTCFTKLKQKGQPHCYKCNAVDFQENRISNDFLNKLKLRPGIGRAKRYQNYDLLVSSSESSDYEVEERRDETMTLEKLFQMPSEKIQHLFNSKTTYDGNKTNNDCGDVQQSKSSPKKVSLSSSKPLICVHNNCGQMITTSTFAKHLKHDHSDIPTFGVERSKELNFIHSVTGIEYDKTICVAAITVYEIYLCSFLTKETKKGLIGTFWLMVTGSTEKQKGSSYVLYWLMTDLNEKFHCTIELASEDENCCNSAFCFVNGILESNSIDRVVNQLNCLNLCYSSMHNLLEEGDKLHLRIKIH